MAAFSDKSQKEIKEGEVVTVCGKLRKGYEYPDIRFAAVAEDDIFSTAKKPKKKKKATMVNLSPIFRTVNRRLCNSRKSRTRNIQGD